VGLSRQLAVGGLLDAPTNERDFEAAGGFQHALDGHRGAMLMPRPKPIERTQIAPRR
jgi:hypothetical protein